MNRRGFGLIFNIEEVRITQERSETIHEQEEEGLFGVV